MASDRMVMDYATGDEGGYDRYDGGYDGCGGCDGGYGKYPS